ncbi:MAG: alpha-L-arabinofuranosidase [Verrucomicrobiota bacterium]
MMSHLIRLPRRMVLLLATFWMAGSVHAQSPLLIYSDNLVNGFQDWSWAPHNLANPAPVHGGSSSISVTSAVWQAVSFYHSEFDTSTYSDFDFWAHGGSAGGQRLQVYAETNGGAASTYTLPGPLPANTWQRYTIPLATLGVANRPNVTRFSIQLRDNGTTGVFYLDDIQITAKPAPAQVNVSVQATQQLATVDERHFGVNLTMWDTYFDFPSNITTTALLQEMGTTVVRMPGGSLSDEYHWGSNKTLTNTWEWAASFTDMVRVSTNAGVQAFIVVNYGSGTPQEAAGWVRHANLTNNLGYKYWEIGNECYGLWETDTNAFHHDPYTYAVRASNYIAQMKAADPTIKIGVVSAPGENSYSNQFNYLHPAYNARTGQTNYGWTPIMLATLKSMNVTPDFLVHHHYPQYTDGNNPAGSSDNDLTLLQSTGNWATDAATLRQHITDYFGAGGTNIELVVTENNADSGAQGRQSTSIVNGLYYADSFAQLLKTEFKGFVWWDLRNGTDMNGFFDASIYGWRTYGDLGMVNGLNTRHPTFYAAKLMQWFARPGDKILNVTSDYQWLSTYAARRANGSVALFVLNKSLVTNLNAQITLNGFTPISAATVRSFGVLNDEATRTNGPAAAKDITTNSIANAGANFTYNFPMLSMTLVTLAPTAPSLAAVSSASAGQFVFQLQGQPDVRYVIQSSTNLIHWTAQATNTLTAGTLNLTNAIVPTTPQKYWRAVWQP